MPPSLPPSLLLIVAVALVVTNAVTWATFRLDKAHAQRPGARRVSERRLLQLAAVGGFGAVIAMYAHRNRHKVNKSGFVRRIWGLVGLQAAALGLACAWGLGLLAAT